MPGSGRSTVPSDGCGQAGEGASPVSRSLNAARRVIAATPGFEPLGEAASGEEALALAAELSPELILLDVRMPVMDGIETARRLSAEHPGAVVVLISINDPAELPQGVECCGAKALIRKQDFGSGRPHQPTARSGAGVPSGRSLPVQAESEPLLVDIGTGTVPRTLVPAPGRDWTSSLPPTTASRSRMLVKPAPALVSSSANPPPSSRTSKSSVPFATTEIEADRAWACLATFCSASTQQK